jgi:hypothetical protein
MANTKLMKVMEYLINEQEDKARDLLHQIFIEKARAIHEEMMMQDDDTLGGDQGEDLIDDISEMNDEIDAEEHMGEDVDPDVSGAMDDLSDELDVDMEDDADVVDVEDDAEIHMDDEEPMDTDADEADVTAEPASDDEDMEHKLMDLETAIEELRKEFEALEDHADDSEDADDASEDTDADHEEEKVDEAWETMDEDDDFADLEESIAQELAQVSVSKAGEVGAGKFARAETNTHSPLPASQKDHMGAKPVKTGEGKKAQGYDREHAPEHKSLGAGTGRRKDAEDNKHTVSKEGDSSALLNKDRSEGFGAVNTRSPIKGR